MEAFLVSMGVVALAEIGDRTQLLALVLAARKLPMRVVHGVAGAIFLVLGVLVLLGAGSTL